MPIFISIFCLKINPQVICTKSEVGGRWGVLGQRQAMGCRGGKQLLLLPARRRKALESPVVVKGGDFVGYTPKTQ